MQKRLIILTTLITCHLIVPVIEASEKNEPYILTTTINALPVKKSDCTALIQEQYDNPETTSKTREQYQTQLSELETQFNELNQLIDSLQSDSEYSIDHATQMLNETIETIYKRYSEQDAEFSQLNEEEKLVLVKEDEAIVAWKNQLDKIISEQNEAIALKNQVEEEYKQIFYLLERENQIEDTTKTTDSQLNQCLLYAYSVSKLPSDAVMIDMENTELSAFVASLDQYLQKLIPYAYRNVTFEQIYQSFNRMLSPEELAKALSGKEHVVIDELALQQYTYEKELSRYDIDILAYKAQRELNTSNDDTAYLTKYTEVLNLKEAQFNYFVQLNHTTWDKIKNDFANYLNKNGYTDEKTVQTVQQLHLKNQVKLVLLDETTGKWSAVDNQQSGYFTQYDEKKYQLFAKEIESTTSVMHKDNTSAEKTEKNIKDNQSHLDYLKEKLSSNKSNVSGDKTLPKTNDLPKPTKKNDHKQVKLPSTGELVAANTIALVLLIIGAILLLVNQREKRKRKENLDEIELD